MRKNMILVDLACDLSFMASSGYVIQVPYEVEVLDTSVFKKGKQTHPPKNYSNRKGKKW
jgi:hypothetical protein